MTTAKSHFARPTALAAILASALWAQPMALLANDGANPLTEPSTGSFPDPTLSRWQERAFEGSTKYELVSAGSEKVLKGFADGTASVYTMRRR